MNNPNNKLWSGRFKENTSELLDAFNSSLSFDKRLYKEDIICSIAQAKMLEKVKIITKQERDEILRGLQRILEEIETEKEDFDQVECYLLNKSFKVVTQESFRFPCDLVNFRLVSRANNFQIKHFKSVALDL